MFATPVKESYLDYRGKRVLNVMFSSTLIERCAILFDALIKEGEAEGYPKKSAQVLQWQSGGWR
ncbi:hypothetical protein ACW9IF_01230 [Pseudomonas tolaasii]